MRKINNEFVANLLIQPTTFPKCKQVGIGLLLLLCITFSAMAQPKQGYPETLRQLQANVVSHFLSDTPDKEVVTQLVNTINDKGQWTNIDYTSLERGRWPLLDHLRNLQTLTIAYEKPGSIYRNNELLAKLQLALNYWLDNDFNNPNWWNPQIGVPKLLAPVLVTLEPILTPTQLEKGMKILNRSAIGMGGQNKVWLSGNVLMKNLLLRNADSVSKAAASIREELRVSKKLGIQHDMSFHEHGAMLQFGNYGLHYLEDMIMWTTILNKTPFAFEEKKMTILRDYVLNGMQWVLYKKSMDISASGRHLFEGEQVKKRMQIMRHLKQLQSIDPPFTGAYKNAQNYSNLLGNKHFWRSDFHVHRAPGYYFSIKLSSSRVKGYETANFENLRGYHTGSGMTLLYQTDEEYTDIFPYWDWKKLPGTTIIQDTAAITVSNAWGYTIEGDFVGGVSDGENGVAVLKYTRGGLTAKKSWFMFDDKIVCLGSGISAATGYSVTTSVNQTYLKGDITINTKSGNSMVRGEKAFSGANWLLHDNVGYLFPDGGKLHLAAKNVTGSWYNVAHRYPDKKVTAPIFKLWLDHGKNPVEQQYQYIIVPNANTNLLASLAKNQPFTLFNDTTRQAVVSNDGSKAGIVFYVPGKATIFGGITVDRACIVMVKREKNGISVSVCDPTQKLTDLEFSIAGKYYTDNATWLNGFTAVKIKLPSAEAAGKTVSFLLREK